MMTSTDADSPAQEDPESAAKPVAHCGPLTHELFDRYMLQFAAPFRDVLSHEIGQEEVATDVAEQAWARFAMQASRGAIPDVGERLAANVLPLLEREIPRRNDPELVGMVADAVHPMPKERSAEELFRRHNGNVVRAVYGRLTQNMEDAKDAAQKAWITFLLKADKFDPAKCKSFTGWITTIARNHFLDAKRTEGNRRDALRSTYGKESLLHHPWMTQEAVRDAMDRLSVESRDVLQQYYFEKKKPKQIARETGESVTTINRRLRRAREAVRQILIADSGID